MNVTSKVGNKIETCNLLDFSPDEKNIDVFLSFFRNKDGITKYVFFIKVIYII